MSRNTLLIIEDSYTQGRIISQRFETLTGFTIVIAQTLADATILAEEHKESIFVALVDMNLPDAPNGEAVDLCVSRKIPAIVLAATIDEKSREVLAQKHVADYFLKGTIDDLEPLVDAVRRIHANYTVKALVVDDSSAQRNLVKSMLKVQCIESEEASDGVEALAVLKANPDIKLVITDFNMPNMDGVKLVQEIRSKKRISDLAVIGLSAAGGGSMTAQFLKNGANDFLTKPFEVEEFYWRVNQTLNILEVMSEIKELKRARD